jgi:spermidine/putrescine transport system substrate-binding protein
MSFTLDRRRFGALLGAGVVAGTVGLPLRRAQAADTIYVLNWQGYGTDEAWALKAFTEKTGITVKHDYFNSEEEMLTKLRTNPGTYDVVLINSARTLQAQAEDLLEPIDLSKVANAKDLSPQLRDHANFNKDGKTYGVSWLWGINALGLRRDKVKADSLSVLADPAYAGRVALFDDAVTAIGIGALMTGQDINAPKDMDAVAAKLKALKPGVKLLWSSEDQWNKAFAAGEFDVSIYWSGAAVRSQRNFKLAVDFIVPKEGGIGWIDGLSMPATSTKKDSALAFINYMIDPGFYDYWATNVGAPASANAVAMDKLPADDLNKQIHKAEYLSKLQFMSPLSDDQRTAFSDLWQETKAFYAS